MTTRTHFRLRSLAAALGLCLAPALALAGGEQAKDTKATKDAKSTPMATMSAEARDAYREGQIWGTYIANPTLESYEIDVDVRGDTATLVGTVDNFVEKRLAERIAGRIEGIKTVNNLLVVEPLRIVTVVDTEPGFADFVADATTAAMIDSKLLWNSYTDGLDIDVAVLGGIATLTGTADTPASKDLAGRLADDTPGVIAVRNLLTVDKAGRSTGMVDSGDGKPTPGDSWIAAKVDSTLRWSTGVDAEAINVASSDGVVRLKGKVDSAYQKELAIELAQNTRGVQRVDASALKVGEQDNRVSQN